MENNKKTWKPLVAGILNIIVGSSRLVGVLGVIIAIIVLNTTSYWWDQIERDVYPMTIGFVIGTLIVIAIFLAATGILSLLGGISGVQRKRWGLALAGSIASVFGPIILGLPALIFTVISKDEF